MKKNILIFEDNPYMSNLVKSALEEKGYNVTITINVNQCLEKIYRSTNKTDLILLDTMIPENQLKDIFQQINNPKIAYMNIVKKSNFDNKLLLNQSAITDYVTKSLEELTTSVDYLLSENNIEIKKEMEKCQNLLITIPNADYETIVTDIIRQISSKRICYVSLNKTYNSLKNSFNKTKISTSNITFIDGITRTIINAKNKKDCHYINSPGDLKELIVIISMLLNRGVNYLIFDSLSDLLTYRNYDEVEQFVNNLTYSLIKNKCKGIFYAISRYKFGLKNRPTDILYQTNNKEDCLLIEEHIYSIDKVVDLRKKCV
jgi:DNA-binding response OmpR family regulator